MRLGAARGGITSQRMSSETPEPPKPPSPASGKPAPEKPSPEKPSPEKSGPPGTPAEIGGPKGPEPTRYGDWEQKGRCTDF
jgi:hypothetical protein